MSLANLRLAHDEWLVAENEVRAAQTSFYDDCLRDAALDPAKAAELAALRSRASKLLQAMLKVAAVASDSLKAARMAR